MITKIDRICRKNAISSSADPRTRRLLTSRFHLYIENLYRIQKFWGHMLRRHSNPTKKNKVWWPRQTKLLVGFYGFLWFLMSFYRFWTVFYGLWRSCFIKNLVLLTKTWFFSQKLAQNQVLIPRPAFFRDLVDVGYMMMISNCGKYLSQPSLRSKISFIY